jgi:hypothetical protein
MLLYKHVHGLPFQKKEQLQIKNYISFLIYRSIAICKWNVHGFQFIFTLKLHASDEQKYFDKIKPERNVLKFKEKYKDSKFSNNLHVMCD